jgi:hypothetical protein
MRVPVASEEQDLEPPETGLLLLHHKLQKSRNHRHRRHPQVKPGNDANLVTQGYRFGPTFSEEISITYV